MKSINFQQYREIVSNDILNYSLSQLQNKYSYDIKFLYSILNDLSLGSGSSNYKLINKIANELNVPFQFIVNTANKLISEINIEGSLNYYEVLNVNHSANSDEIRDNWLNLVKQNHPDLVGDKGVEKTKELNEAYEVLKDSKKRDDYDKNFFDYYPLIVEYTASPGFYSRKYLMLYSLLLVIAISFLLKGYFENFINNDKKKPNLASRQLEYFEEVDKEKLELKYKKDVEKLYSNFDKGKDKKIENKNEKKVIEEQASNKKILTKNPKEDKVTEIDQTDSNEKEKIVQNKENNPVEVIEVNSQPENPKTEEYDPLLNSLIKKYGSKNRKNKKKEKSVENNKSESKQLIKTANPVKKIEKKQDPLPVKKINTDNTPKNDTDVIVKNEEPVVASIAPVNNQPTSTSLFLFVSDYVSAYKNRDFNMMEKLFMPDASENNMNMDQALAMYKSNFQKHKIIRYDIQVKNKTINGDNALVNGQFVVIYKNNEDEKVNTRNGDISWKLKWINEEWKIKSLNYKFDKKDNYL